MNKIILNNGPLFPLKPINRRNLVYNINKILLTHNFKGSEFIRKNLSMMFLPKFEKRILCSTIGGIKLIIHPHTKNIIENEVYYYGIYEAGVINVLKNFLKPGDIFFDIGTNLGIISLTASKFVGDKGKVYSFEPEPTIFSKFKKNISFNNINNIQAFNFGLGSKNEKIPLYYNEEYGNAGLVKSGFVKCIEREARIEVLDEFVSKKNIDNIKMMKIDVEGWEFEVLKGAEKLLKSKNAPILCIEYFEHLLMQKGNPLDIIDFILSVNNYKIYKFSKGKSFISDLIYVKNKRELPKNNDNLFCFLPKHINNYLKES